MTFNVPIANQYVVCLYTIYWVKVQTVWSWRLEINMEGKSWGRGQGGWSGGLWGDKAINWYLNIECNWDITFECWWVYYSLEMIWMLCPLCVNPWRLNHWMGGGGGKILKPMSYPFLLVPFLPCSTSLPTCQHYRRSFINPTDNLF